MTTQARELAKLVNNSGDVNLVDDITLGSDGALLNFGADSDVVITHVADTGLLLNSSRQLQFGDSGTHIRQSADGVLQLTSDTEVEINATTIDINGNVDISGNLVLGGNITIGDADSDDISFGGELTSHIIPNADDTFDLGSSTKQWRNVYVDGTLEADAITVDGTSLSVITTENVQDIVGAMVTSNTETNITVTYEDSDGTLDFVVPSTLSGVTELGTLTTLQVDNININGNTITASSGALNLTPAGGSAIVLDGTINIDAGVVTGATSITSTAFVGGLTGNVTGNTSGTAATVTTAAQPNITSLGTLTTLTVDDITINGSTISDGADLTLDVEGNIVLDANGGGVYFKDAGTTIGFFQNDGGDFRMISSTSDKDIKFMGNDGGSTITALSLDMSDGGNATFNKDIFLSDNSALRLGSSQDFRFYHDGTDSFIINDTGTLQLNNNDIRFKTSGAETMLRAVANGAVELMHNNSTKIATSSTGVSVTGNAIGTLTTDNDGSFSMAASNNFKCTPSGNFTLTFTNIVSQSGNILLINSGGHTVSAHSNTKVDATILGTISTAGTYLLAYFSDGTNVYMTNSAVYS